jgi:hypothetical protein
MYIIRYAKLGRVFAKWIRAHYQTLLQLTCWPLEELLQEMANDSAKKSTWNLHWHFIIIPLYDLQGQEVISYVPVDSNKVSLFRNFDKERKYRKFDCRTTKRCIL